MDYENIYIHIPFCEQKCDYCGFYSEAAPKAEKITAFLDKLENKLKTLRLHEPVETLFFGGGTPSLLAPVDLQRLHLMVQKYIPLKTDAEISMECNPETLTPARLDVIKPMVNRVSIGVQSFSNKFLDILGRKGSQEHIESALRLVNEYDFNNLSIDLIYGIPGQTNEQWLSNLHTAVNANIKHISCYSLTLEEGSELGSQIDSFAPVEDEAAAEMWIRTGDFLEKQGINRYEVSNYAKPGSECRHNVNIWHGQTYLGLGPAASSFDGRTRWTEPASLEDWLQGKEPEKDVIEPEYRMIEIFIIGLRTAEGWTREHWENIPLQQIMNIEWQTMVQKSLKVRNDYPELIDVSPKYIRLTQQGLLFWNTIAEAWLE